MTQWYHTFLFFWRAGRAGGEVLFHMKKTRKKPGRSLQTALLLPLLLHQCCHTDVPWANTSLPALSPLHRAAIKCEFPMLCPSIHSTLQAHLLNLCRGTTQPLCQRRNPQPHIPHNPARQEPQQLWQQQELVAHPPLLCLPLYYSCNAHSKVC